MSFLTDDFLLTTETSRHLYHEFAEKCPIYDYHCHIDPKDIYEDRRFTDITEVWLEADHYKWRIMRSAGIDEYYITGDAPHKEKFVKFASALPRCIGNPMYHWCHLELKNYFGYTGVLSAETADEVWELAIEKLAEPDFSARGLIRRSNVAMIGTTDDPTSDLEYHRLIAEGRFETKVCPTFRPDNILHIYKPTFPEYMKKFASVCGFELNTVSDIKRALTERIEFFVSRGCRASDHGLDYMLFRPVSADVVEVAYKKAMAGEALTLEETEGYITELNLHCAREYARLGLVMQLHFSCMRNPNSRRLKELGVDTGFDSMAARDNCKPLYELMDALDIDNSLPKTIIYSLNPADNQWIDTLIGAFQDSTAAGKIQHGSAWWFNDNKTGMRDHLTSLANLSILGNFVGMLTDSRSLLSYTRHEYFRRILCELIGSWVEGGEYPRDYKMLGDIVVSICSGNAKRYFDL